MNILVISDTHCNHKNLDVYLEDPEFIKDVDVIIHAGDAADSKSKIANEIEMHDFLEWYSDLDIPNKLFVPGNHDISIEAGMITERDYPDVEFLINQSMYIDGVNFYGSPYTPTFGTGWAYNVLRHKLEDCWEEIPEETDVLITHGPPKGILDLTHTNGSSFEAVGCKSLFNRVFSLSKLQYHVFGHVHDEKNITNSGYRILDNKVFVNACMSDLSNRVINQPIKIFI